MTYLGIIVTSVFATNALLTYGLGSIPQPRSGRLRGSKDAVAAILSLVGVNALASAFLWCIHTLVLAPLGLKSLDLFFFTLFAVPLFKFIGRAAALSGSGLLSLVGTKAENLIVGSLVFGLALISSNGGYSLPEALAGSAASGLGLWMATSLLQAIGDRLELSGLPRFMKGSPAMFLSAGLMAIALMGVDATFVKGIAG